MSDHIESRTLEPPLTNRGVEIHADYLALTFWGNPSRVFPIIFKCLWDLEPENWEDPLQARPHGARGFHRLWIGPDGCRFYGFPVSAEALYCAFEIPGEPISYIDDFHSRVVAMKDALAGLDVECRCSRFDVAWDHCPFTPQQAYDEWQAGRVKTRIRKDHHLWISSTEGKTLYVGSSKSEKRIRIYDRRGYTRCELQARKNNAHAVFTDYLHFPENLPAWLCGVVAWEADWYESFLAEPIRLRSATQTDSFLLQKFRRHLLRMVPTLRIARSIFGGSIDDWLDRHDYNLSGTQQAKLARLLRQGNASPDLRSWPNGP